MGFKVSNITRNQNYEISFSHQIWDLKSDEEVVYYFLKGSFSHQIWDLKNQDFFPFEYTEKSFSHQIWDLKLDHLVE
mgnify:CR=1 FL=1